MQQLGPEPLAAAARAGHTGVVRALLEAGYPVDVLVSEGARRPGGNGREGKGGKGKGRLCVCLSVKGKDTHRGRVGGAVPNTRGCRAHTQRRGRGAAAAKAVKGWWGRACVCVPVSSHATSRTHAHTHI